MFLRIYFFTALIMPLASFATPKAETTSRPGLADIQASQARLLKTAQPVDAEVLMQLRRQPPRNWSAPNISIEHKGTFVDFCPENIQPKASKN